MPFPPEERKALLALKGVGPTVLARLEQMGIGSLAQLADADVRDIVSLAAGLTGSTCWKNSPQARAGLRTPIALEKITAKTLVLAGDTDMLATQPEKLAAAIPGAEVKVIAGDHMRVVGTAAFRSAIVQFFA